MATKAELEAEVALLRETNEALKAQAKKTSPPEDPPSPSKDTDLSTHLTEALKEHGIDTADLEALGNQLADEVTKLQKDHPLATLLGVFVAGCLVGRALK